MDLLSDSSAREFAEFNVKRISMQVSSIFDLHEQRLELKRTASGLSRIGPLCI
jgi:hypothetical protein